ncbi:tRNA uridine-5-carboxymethylaminomethyl(34) synthesis GTPase MnmE [Alphaproteobacteria bacterium]|nr:tRNA uridine-5-carboxymethylaminomethyl(34) synthesis GTPase MnmE [Alphaproteobacteria bacterium]
MVETIYAPITANGVSATSVFRFSGKETSKILKALIKSKKLPIERKLVLKKIYQPNSNNLLDIGLICWMPKPKSFTGEDCFEIHCHGGMATSQALIDAFSKIKGLRFADAGEFSKRALINGKMNLVEAEAVNQIISAETESQRVLNLQQLEKGLSIPIKSWRKKIIYLLSKIEAAIDFSDEDGVPESINVSSEIKKIAEEIIKVIKKGNRYELISEGAKVTITGPPNSGKSSLFNYIINKEKSIVTNIPGTTRDVVEKKINLRGLPVSFLDTAGIRATRDIVEKEGIKRAKEAIQEADIVLNIQDATKSTKKNTMKITSEKSWIVFNKIDKLGYKMKENDNCFLVSAKTGKGINKLLNEIYNHVAHKTKETNDGIFFFTNERQKVDLKKALSNLRYASIEIDEEIIAEYLRAAAVNLERILGKIDVEEVLGDIFSSFCIGK